MPSTANAVDTLRRWEALSLQNIPLRFWEKTDTCGATLAQHLERFWSSFDRAVDTLDLGHIGIIQNARRDFPDWRVRWQELDLLSSWVSLKPEAEDVR